MRDSLRSAVRTARFVWSHPLNRGGRLRAIARLLRWQAVSRVARGPVVLPFVDGTRLVAAPGMHGATGNWYCGLHEPGEMGFVLHALRPGELFVDVGANVGSYTVLAAGAVGARVIAVEPVRAAFDALARNVAANGLEARVRCLQCGVAAATGALAFTQDRDCANRVATAFDTAATVVVPVRTLDEICGDETPTLVKVDVEGFEREVVAGGARTLAAPGLLGVVMETNGSGARYGSGRAPGALVSAMRERGFGAYEYDPVARMLRAVHRGESNTIFVRDATTVSGRLRTARRYALVNGEI